ncbi:hypothetical protein [Shouchella clausii]|uniref:hypothetical protein n=1 Tax=Shouchella clausii TaxID=79880 RepID=UPI001155054D|nr:hypothetical protein [Shouchella clausii]
MSRAKMREKAKQIKDREKEHKNAVQAQFRAKMKQVKQPSKPSISQDQPRMSISEQLQIERKKRKRLSKQLLHMEKKIEQTTAILTKKEAQTGKLKKQVSQLSKQLEQAKAVGKRAKETSASVTEENQSLKRELLDLQNEIGQARNQLALHHHHLKRIGNLERKNKALKEQMKQLFAQQQTPDERLQQQLKKRKEEVQQLQRCIRRLKKKKEPTVLEMHQQLCQQLTTETLKNYLPNGRHLFAELVQDIETLVKRQKKQNNQQTPEEPGPDSSLLFGTTFRQQQTENLLFRDLDGKVYQIEHQDEVDHSELPVKAKRVSENKVEIIKAYQTMPKQMRRCKRKAKKQQVKDKPLLIPIGTFRVCLIGAQRLQQYKKRLEQYGVHVTVCNPYEDGAETIRNACKKSALTIVCTQHTSHTALALARSSSQHLECIKHDNEDNLVARTRFFAKWRLLQIERDKKTETVSILVREEEIS